MKKLIALFAASIMIAISANVMAQNSATVTDAKASATIIKPITLNNTQEMKFGRIASDDQAGDVVLASTGGRTFSNTDLQVVASSGHQNAIFTVSGESNTTYVINLPSAPVEMVRTDGSEKMTIETFTHSLVGQPALDNSGNGSFKVGATLKVGASQVAGNYTGTYEVTVAYN